MNIEFKFISHEQEVAFRATQKFQCLCGGYGSGKTFIACYKAITLLLSFPNSRWAFIRKELKVLRITTMQTFLKIMPEHLIKSHSTIDGRTELVNGSMIYWLGLDRFDEQNLKSLELNGAFIDQAEEIDEVIYTHLTTRVGRWDMAEVPAEILTPDWPKNISTGRPIVPTYIILAVNPDTEFHWIYKEFHPESQYWKDNNQRTHFYINMPSTSNTALSPEVLETMLKKDPQFVRRYVMGEWGYSDAQIHRISENSIIEVDNDFLENFKAKALLYRTYDHGESSPSVCLWGATFKGTHIIYREYYKPNTLISEHRRNISDLSSTERYNGNFADPEIFRKKAQKQGSRWCTADEYLDRRITEAAPIFWEPADNNELGTRNRINELLQPDKKAQHPVTGEYNSPRLYFVKYSSKYPQGCKNVISETNAQRREKLGEINGKPIWSEDRQKGISDHAYDALRYYVAIHSNKDERKQFKENPNSFAAHWKRAIKGKGIGAKGFSYV
jgi:hypothetical protein